MWSDRGLLDDAEFVHHPVVACTNVLVREWQGGHSGSLLENGCVKLRLAGLPVASGMEKWWSDGGSPAFDAAFAERWGRQDFERQEGGRAAAA